ncbi:MAG: universal stress protein [Rhodothermales bacterium]
MHEAYVTDSLIPEAKHSSEGIVMWPFKRILFPTDFSPCADAALQPAYDLGRRSGAEVHILHVVPGPAAAPEQTIHHLQTFVSRAVEGASSLDDRNGLTLVYDYIRCDSIADGILTYAMDCQADLVVMGTHGRNGINRLLVGSVTAEVLRRINVPVLAVHEGVAWSMPRRLLLGYDFSQQSLDALEAARELALAFGAELDVVFAANDLVLPDLFGISDPEAPSPTIRGRFRNEIRRHLADLDEAGLRYEIYVVGGNAVNQIAEHAARLDAGLVLLAGHGGSGMALKLGPHLTERLLHRVTQPVLIVPPCGKPVIQLERRHTASML